MKICFQADADLHVPIVKGLKRREPTIDFATANDAGLAGLDDLAVLALAASRNRVLVSHDVSTMPKNFAVFIEEQTSPGVILVSQELSYSQAIEGLIRFGSALTLKTGRTSCHSCRDEFSRMKRLSISSFVCYTAR